VLFSIGPANTTCPLRPFGRALGVVQGALALDN
jgi:hypothetical protein